MHSKWRYQICISVFGHSRRTLVFSKLRRIQNYFPENFRCNLTSYEGDNFSDSFFHHIFESKNFLGSFLLAAKNSLTQGVKCEKLTSENRREFISKIRWASKIVHEWNGHLNFFSQNLFLRTDILQKTVVGCPWSCEKNNNRSNCTTLFLYISLPLICMTATWNVPKTSWFSLFMEEMWYMFLFTFSTAALFFLAPL